jgi:uncharacterized LabA/DUF88 family protein
MTTETNMNGNQLAIYWDFENIHISVAKLRSVTKTHLSPRIPQEKVIDLAKIMDHLHTMGPISINRAYGNWQWMGAYQEDLLKHSIDLIQMFPAGLHAKNGADIRLALDAFEDACRLPPISHVVIISGDSDFISAAQKLRALGKTVIGIGTRDATNKYWSLACTSFNYYEDVVPPPLAAPVLKPIKSSKPSKKPGADLPATKTVAKKVNKTPEWLLRQGLAQLLRDSDKDYAQLSQLRPAIAKIDPKFTPENIGHTSMSKFVQAYPKVIRMVKTEGTHHIYAVGTKQKLQTTTGKAPELTPAYLLELFTAALSNRSTKRLSKAALHQLVMDAKPALADTSSRLMAEVLAQIPELEISAAFVSLSDTDCSTTDETRSPTENTTQAGLACLDADFIKHLQKQGIFSLPAPQWTQVLMTTHDYFQENNYQLLGARPELTDKLLDRCNSKTRGSSLTRVMINRLISSFIRSQTLDIQQPDDGERTWTLKKPFQSPGLLIEHLTLFLLYRGIQSGYTCCTREWSIFLYGDDSHEDYIDSLKIRLFHEDYAAQFDYQPQSASAAE